MVKQIWLNLPVKDVQKSKEFFLKLGFELNTQNGNTENSACFLIGINKFVLMLFDEKVFSTFTQHTITNTKESSEILISFDAESKEEVDEITNKAEMAGGIVYAKPSEVQGWMYGSGFCDLDGHRWNILFMDFSKLPK